MLAARGAFTAAAGDRAGLSVCAMRKTSRGRAAATTAGPENSMITFATTATGALTGRRDAGAGTGAGRPTPLTAHASTSGINVAMFNAGPGAARKTRLLDAARWRELPVQTA
jgi:hypothetical protein